MDFSVMFWGDASSCEDVGRYHQDVVRLAKVADEEGFVGVWLPERHFNPWGGQHPNPAVLAAALAVTTRSVRLRAGSVVLPLHHPIRVAEEWAVVDNLSGGRAELSIATGWNADDFVFAPDNYRNRKSEVWSTIETVQRLWRGESHRARNGNGQTAEVSTYPRPRQPHLPIWITSAGGVDTMEEAGRRGFGLLTHLLGQDFDTLAGKLARYYACRAEAQVSSQPRVALMVHAFLGRRRSEVKETVRPALRSYLQNSAALAIPAEKRAEWAGISDVVKRQMAETAFERYFETASLMGTTESCLPLVARLREMGVTEICCLIDFGLPTDLVAESLRHLTELREAAL
jgi:natural product biosynthesis luciferase-like monooxygenase protein